MIVSINWSDKGISHILETCMNTGFQTFCTWLAIIKVEVRSLKAKDLLTAIQIDAAGELKKLSSYTYVFVKDGDKQTNHLRIKTEESKIILQKQQNQVLTLNELIKVLNTAKESEIYVEDELVFGYKLVKQGISLG